MWYSPVTWSLGLIALVDLIWLGIFAFHLTAGDRSYVFPEGLRAFIASRLTIGGVDLTYPAVLAYNVFLVLGPLALLLFPSVRDWTGRLGGEVREAISSRPRRAWALLLASIVVALVFIPLADHTRLPFVQERVRWATDWFPLPTPVDPPLLVRTEYLLTRVLDARYTFVLAELAVHAILLGYLVRWYGGRRVALPVTLGYAAAAATFRSFYFLNGAEAELPAAAFGLMAYIEVGRRRYVPGVVLFFLALAFKPTAIYLALSAAGLVLWRLVRREARWRELPWREAGVAVVVVAAFWVGMLVNVLQLRGFGAGSLFAGPETPFFVHAASVFLGEFVTVYPVQVMLAVAGLVLAGRDRGFLAYLVVSTFVLRSTSPVAGGYYTTFFLPLWCLLAAGLLVRLWPLAHSRSPLPRHAISALVATAALVGNAAAYAAMPDKADWITRANSGWGELIDDLARDTPRGAVVYFRKVSPRYDLERRGRADLRFFEIPERESEALARLSRSGPVLYVAPYRDLRGADGPLGTLGYQVFTKPFGGRDDPYVILVKRQ